ncbi:AraC family transcriptional regulator [Cohnella nanjingensis]|uniref:Helix-turn-helix domain-containing protein n=1 Tax=Cohnella nanjingensis TaxID=1387779 RepID=A0A7X0VE23_9BACL|nr:helix-turn-helix domain-containing protein [Cohnella nanjingensis]MBB6670555.1 helix-turn-helix domain-containing protein [Cohnella nanjingensis]
MRRVAEAEEGARFGLENELYMEYRRRTEPFTMSADHYHPYYEIYYLLSGSRVYFVRDRSYPVEQGDLVFIPKNELHKTMQAGVGAHERIILHFGDGLADSLTAAQAELLLSPFRQKTHVIRLPRAEQIEIDRLLRRSVSEIRSRPPGYELVPRMAVMDVLLQTARYLREHEPMPVGYATPMHAKLTEVVRYVNARYGEPLKLGELAERFYISPHYLSRLFKETTGFTFTDYLVLTRVKEAQRLLRDTDLKIADIAVSAGFDNFSHFGKTFKRIARLSPRDYRKRERG